MNGESGYDGLEETEAGGIMSSYADPFDEELGFGEGEEFDVESLESSYVEGELGEEFAEFEGDPFLGGVWKKVKSVARKVAPVLKKLAPIAGKVVGGALGGPAGAMIGSKLGGGVSNLEAEEFDGEGDTEDEIQATTVPGLTAIQEALAEEFAAESAETENQARPKGSPAASPCTS